MSVQAAVSQGFKAISSTPDLIASGQFFFMIAFFMLALAPAPRIPASLPPFLLLLYFLMRFPRKFWV